MNDRAVVFPSEEFNKLDNLIKIKANRLYRSIKCYSLDENDLYQEGWVGLLDSWQRFKGRNSASFITFAYKRIVGSMQGIIRYMLTGSKHPDKTGERSNKQVLYFDDSKFDDFASNRHEYTDFIIDCDIFLSRIGEKEKEIFFRYYVLDEPFQKIAPDVGVSWQTVNRIVRSLDAEIRDYMYKGP